LSESQWWSADQLQARQLEQINALLTHTRAQSPYFARLLSSLPPRLSEADWQTLPTLGREAVQTQRDQIRCAVYPGAHGQRQAVFSSGSTGKPVSTEQTDLSQLFWEAFTLREHLWHRRDFAGKLASLRHYPTGVVSARGGHGPNWGSATAELIQTGPVAMLNVTASVDEQLQWLRHENPDYLLTHPTVLSELLDTIQSQGPLNGTRLREVRTISESLPDGLRARCQDILGVPLTDIYSAREVGYIALQCPDQPHYHVQSENARVEVLDDDNRPCAPGMVGRVIVTPLHNFAFPLIRYEIGDYAEVGAPCACGRGLPVIQRVMGRRRNMLTLPDGKRSWPIINFKALNDIVPVRQMRMTQRALDHIEVELVTPTRPDAALEARMITVIRDSLGYPFELTFQYPARIARSAGGKFEDFVSLVG
jgi:phenylacetate-CoA ligase